MKTPYFLQQLSKIFLTIILVVPIFTALTPQKAFAAIPVTCTNCYTEVSGHVSLIDQFINTAKNIITSIQSTITAVKTTALVYKEFVLDPAARILGDGLTGQLVDQMFSFVSTGNHGAPTFVTNPQQYFGGVAQESTQGFLTDLENNRPDVLPSINQAVLQRITAQTYTDSKSMEQSTFPGGDTAYQEYLQHQNTCVTGNSWDCYFATLEPQNNPYTVYTDQLSKEVSKGTRDVSLAQDQISWGQGYHSLQDCVENDINGNCTNYLTKTPGSTISQQVNEYLTSALTCSQNVDELDELICGVKGLVQEWMNGKGLVDTAFDAVSQMGNNTDAAAQRRSDAFKTPIEQSLQQTQNAAVSQNQTTSNTQAVNQQQLVPTIPPPPPLKFSEGEHVKVFGSPADIYDSSTNLLGTQPLDALGTVLSSAPLNRNGGNWWYVDYNTGVDGWTNENNLISVL